MRDDFAVFILTHGRADNVVTVKALEKGGYTGKTYFIIDDEDDDNEEIGEDDFIDIAKMSINCLKNNPLELEKLKIEN